MAFDEATNLSFLFGSWAFEGLQTQKNGKDM